MTLRPSATCVDDLDRRELLVLARRFRASPLDVATAQLERARQIAVQAEDRWRGDCQMSTRAHRAAAAIGESHGCTSREFTIAFAEARTILRLSHISFRAAARAQGDLARAQAAHRKIVKQEPTP